MSSSVSLSCSWCSLCAVSDVLFAVSTLVRSTSPPACLACPPGSARARRHRPLAAAPHGAPASAAAAEAAGGRRLRLRSWARWSVCTVGATTRRARRKRWGPDSVLVPLGRQSRMSPARSNQQSVVSAVESPGRALAGDRGRAVCGPWSRSGHVVSGEAWAAGPVVGVRRLFSGGPCACHRLHRRHPRSGAVKPCASRRCASPVGPGLDRPAGGRR